MVIKFDLTTSVLNFKWQPNNVGLSVTEYIYEWQLVHRCVQELKPNILYIDMEMFGYRILPDIIPIFNNITNLLTPQLIAIIQSLDILGNNKHWKIYLKSAPKKDI